MSFYIDLTGFLSEPLRTGIQRISGELCRHLEPGTAVPVRLHHGNYVALSPSLIAAMGEYFREASGAGEAEMIRLGSPERGSAVNIGASDAVLVPEVFDITRAAFFRDMPEEKLQRCRFIVYDLLPLTHPEYFPDGMSLWTAGYFHVIRRGVDCGFISDYTRDLYYGRLKRAVARGGTVLPLGCDSLGPRRDPLPLNRPLTFTVLGTIEPRKNHEMILDAFELLLRQLCGLRLIFLGKMGWVDSDFARRVRALASDEHSGFKFYPMAGDQMIRDCIEQSRATIYVSAAEGYGLPPVESLWAGTPVIATATIPSLQRLGSAGIHYVEPLNIVNLRRAVLAFVDDEYANQKTKETLQLQLPTWRSFTEEVAKWCESSSG